MGKCYSELVLRCALYLSRCLASRFTPPLVFYSVFGAVCVAFSQHVAHPTTAFNVTAVILAATAQMERCVVGHSSVISQQTDVVPRPTAPINLATASFHCQIPLPPLLAPFPYPLHPRREEPDRKRWRPPPLPRRPTRCSSDTLPSLWRQGGHFRIPSWQRFYKCVGKM